MQITAWVSRNSVSGKDKVCTEEVLSTYLHFLPQPLSLCVCTDLSEGAGYGSGGTQGRAEGPALPNGWIRGWKATLSLGGFGPLLENGDKGLQACPSVGYPCPSQVRGSVERAERGQRAALWLIHSLKSRKIWLSLLSDRNSFSSSCILLMLTHSPLSITVSAQTDLCLNGSLKMLHRPYSLCST